MLLFDKETIALLQKSLKKDGFIHLPAKGISMFPFIKQNDLCRFETCDPNCLKKGQIILFYTHSGQLVAHRFYRTNKINGELFFLFKGDSNFGFDEPVQADQIIGKLTMIERQHKKIYVNTLQAIIWEKLIVSCPLLSRLLRKYLAWHDLLQQLKTRNNNT